MSNHYKHVSDCLEVARNARYCAGAEKAATEIERLQARIELLDKVVDAASACIAAWDNAKWPSPIPLRKALAALKT